MTLITEEGLPTKILVKKSVILLELSKTLNKNFNLLVSLLNKTLFIKIFEITYIGKIEGNKTFKNVLMVSIVASLIKLGYKKQKIK